MAKPPQKSNNLGDFAIIIWLVLGGFAIMARFGWVRLVLGGFAIIWFVFGRFEWS